MGWILDQFRRFKQFLVEVWAELKKTTWPTRREVYGTTVVVVVAVFICALFLYVVDMILKKGVDSIFQAFGQ